MALIWILVATIVYLIYKWGTSTFDFFEKLGLPFNKPYFVVGNNLNMITQRKSMVDAINDNYKKTKHEKLFGWFEMRKPVFLINDPKLMKQLAIKDFDHFTDHRDIFPEEISPLFGKSVFSLKGQRWRDMRATLSPAFTGSKMRQMFTFVNQVGMQAMETMKVEIKNGGKDEFEFKQLVTKFTVDVIASTSFGIEVNSFKNPDNDFQRIAKKATNFSSFSSTLKFVALMIFPAVMKLLKMDLFDSEVTEFFREAIIETMRIREEKGIVRHDMINLLMDARKGQLTHNNNEENVSDGFATVEESQLGKSHVANKLNDDDITAQAFIFFFGGFDTVSTVMSFMAYELTCNPDVQKKLQNEIDEMNKANNGNIDYEKIQSMKYMDQVVCETLRKWPGPVTDRVCVKDYEMEYGDKKFTIKKGDVIFLPIYPIHRDAQYYPEPDRFNPERFNEENRGNIDPDTYIPFGIGPRNCIGSRFALMEIKTIIYYLLLNFNLEVTEKTQIPLKFAKSPLAFKSEKGIWARLKPRD